MNVGPDWFHPQLHRRLLHYGGSRYCTITCSPAMIAASLLMRQIVVLFLYDAIIITGEEIRCFWGRKLTGAAVLFWLNKYMTTLFFVWALAGNLKMSDEVCRLGLSSLFRVSIMLIRLFQRYVLGIMVVSSAHSHRNHLRVVAAL